MQAQSHQSSAGNSGARQSSESHGQVCEKQLMQSMNEWVARDPQSAMLTCFAVGAGIGLVLGLSLGGTKRETSRSWSDWSEATRSWFDKRTAEDLGRRIVDSVTNMLPTSIAERIGVSS